MSSWFRSAPTPETTPTPTPSTTTRSGTRSGDATSSSASFRRPPSTFRRIGEAVVSVTLATLLSIAAAKIITDVATSVSASYRAHRTRKQLDRDGNSSPSKDKANPHARFSRRRTERLKRLTPHETRLLGEIVDPESIPDGFDAVAGLGPVVQEIRELVLYPLSHPELFSGSRLLQTPSSILLYGPPGCGKTLLAKAIAKEAGAAWLNVKPSTLMDKYVGESQKLVEALFSLAQKLSPCVIFLDEVDGVLGVRTGMDHPAMVSMKTQFMAHMDGLSTSGPDPSSRSSDSDEPNDWVLVCGATNRPFSVDPAALRRFGRQVKLSLPTTEARADILKVLLRNEHASPDLDHAAVADATPGYSGSDLKELCRAAAMRPVREVLAKMSASRGRSSSSSATDTDTATPSTASCSDGETAVGEDGEEKKEGPKDDGDATTKDTDTATPSTASCSDGEKAVGEDGEEKKEGPKDDGDATTKDTDTAGSSPPRPRPISTDDLLEALKSVKATGDAAREYRDSGEADDFVPGRRTASAPMPPGQTPNWINHLTLNVTSPLDAAALGGMASNGGGAGVPPPAATGPGPVA